MTKWIRLAPDGSTIDAVYLDEPQDAADFIVANDDVLADWRFVAGSFAPPTSPPAPVPQVISDRQFALQARDQGFISQGEALAFVRTGEIPPSLMAILAALPPAARDDAEITLAGATEFRREHPLTTVIGAAMRGAVPLDDFLDDFFRSAATK